MKLKLLLFLLLTSSIIYAQEVYRSLVITEIRMDRGETAFLELTNMGNKDINLSEFRINYLSFYSQAFESISSDRMFLPDVVLEQGGSFVLAIVDQVRAIEMMQDGSLFMRTKPDLFEIADLAIIKDVTPFHDALSNFYHGGDGLFIEHFVTPTDSVVIDQVGGVFDAENGTNALNAYDVAGVPHATRYSILVRKFNVKTGNLDFNSARGVDVADSEWIVLPISFNNQPIGSASQIDGWRKPYWTLGNHGDYKLDASTLVSDVASVDFDNNTITVPWGVRNLDRFIEVFEKKPGLAWSYHLSPAREDSAYSSARTGDKITIYACGNTVESRTFDIIVNEPTDDDNKVIPMFSPSSDGSFSININSGYAEEFMVSDGLPAMDSIFFRGLAGYPPLTFDGITYYPTMYGIGFNTQVDTLYKYLEKPENATWEIDWVDDTERTVLKNGDILKVTSESGLTKDYYLKVADYVPNNDNALSSITWPDIPEFYKGLFGWKGDTIPGFSPQVTNYTVQVPLEVESVPALMAKTQNLNARVEVNRAKRLKGSVEDRTNQFTVFAEDDTTSRVYNVTLEKEKDPDNLQPFLGEPFISEYVHHGQTHNCYIEIVNPGTEPIDMSDYFIVGGSGSSSPAEAVMAHSGVDQWDNRYRKYVPGYKWGNEEEWSVEPGVLQRDISVNSIVMPGDVFVMGHITSISRVESSSIYEYPWFAKLACDVEFYWENPWGEEVNYSVAKYGSNDVTHNIFLFKILNDSVKSGLKSATDPADFELVDLWGQGDDELWTIGGWQGSEWRDYRNHSFQRKPHIYKGNIEFKGSFGTNEDDTEWVWYNVDYWNQQPIPNRTNDRWLHIAIDIGKHFMETPTVHLSTVSSPIYLVSEGYSMEETIHGLKTGVTVSEFLGMINKANDGQILTVKTGSGASDLDAGATINNNDLLIVLSADGNNTTSYTLSVTEEGLSSDAVLTSALYEINLPSTQQNAGEESNDMGTISGFEYGTQVGTVLNNINVPEGASLTVIDDEGAFVPFKNLAFDTSYVYTSVNDNIYFEVIAEDGVTTISYQLIPSSSLKDAFVLSDVYVVQQNNSVISYVPRGTTPSVFLSNLIPARGASMKLVDKLGAESTDGHIAHDFRLIVTAADGVTKKVYFLSMLPTQNLPLTNYLAYVVSDYYTVDNSSMIIAGATGSTLLSEFLSRITPTFGAEVKIIDKNGAEKTTGDLDDGDILVVTSADGKVTTEYELALNLTTSELLEKTEIVLYPNPSSGKVNINGLNPGVRIQVFNSIGAVVADKVATKDIETIPLDSHTSGVYIILLTHNQKFIGNYKVIKR